MPPRFFLTRNIFLSTELKMGKKCGKSGEIDACILRTGSKQSLPSFYFGYLKFPNTEVRFPSPPRQLPLAKLRL